VSIKPVLEQGTQVIPKTLEALSMSLIPDCLPQLGPLIESELDTLIMRIH